MTESDLSEPEIASRAFQDALDVKCLRQDFVRAFLKRSGNICYGLPRNGAYQDLSSPLSICVVNGENHDKIGFHEAPDCSCEAQ